MLRNATGAPMSFTQGERSALRWLLAVIVTGTGAQLARHWRYSGDVSPASSEALSRQLLAVDSAQRADRRGKPARPSRPRVARGRRGASDSTGAGAGSAGAGRARRRAGASPDAAAAEPSERPTLLPVDLDRADSGALERLPRIGPALAARIVADRSANGSFGSLEALQRVRGIGPKLAERLRALVTFSGTPRPLSVQR